MSKLVIVESPPKAKTIKKFLGPGYEVMASMGHVRDLPENRLSVDVKNDFAPRYAIIKGKEELVEKLKTAAKNAECVYLAADPDREGEAISWHLAYILGLDIKDTNRVTFNEITKSGLDKGIANPRNIDINLVNSQQCRRILDRIVGYRLSPFVSQKIRRGLSAGRVQSVALRMICDREDEIRAFVPQEYWTIEAKLTAPGSKKAFTAEFHGNADGKIELATKEQTDEILARMEGKPLVVTATKKGTRKKMPAPPFITSTLQQEASRRLGFRSSKTMKLAQELYEGIEIGETGAVGLITYMRTDSLRIADEARAAGNEYITNRWGDKYLPDKPHKFKQRANAQDAHEAIRPTDALLRPEKLKGLITNDQYKLYKLIYDRFFASQMTPAVYDTLAVDIDADSGVRFHFNGQKLRFAGFTSVYVESVDDPQEEAENVSLPELKEGMAARAGDMNAEQHFTQPPPRYTEASLVRTLEEKGIGRPSTYAPTISTITGRRGYIAKENKRLIPTELGKIVNDLMCNNFPDIVDVTFTANMEDQLDDVEAGKTDWRGIVSEFYGPFEKDLEKAEASIEKIAIEDQVSDVPCEKCGAMMVYKMSRYGRFLACPNFPACRHTLALPNNIGVPCPKCGGELLERISRKGRKFYGCEKYPECDFVSWDRPVKDRCPVCGSYMVLKRGGKDTLFHVCANETCRHKVQVENNTEDTDA